MRRGVEGCRAHGRPCRFSAPCQAPAPARPAVRAALPEDPGSAVSHMALPERADVPDAARRGRAG